MIGALDRTSNLLRPSTTLPGLVAAFLEPLVVVLTLTVCVWVYDKQLSPPLIILAVLSFVMNFPGGTSLYEQPSRVVRKVLVEWLLFAGILGTFGYVTRYIEVFPERMLLTWGIATPIALLGAHFLLRLTLPQLVALKQNRTTAVVAGVNDISLKLLDNLNTNPYLGTRIVAFFDDRSGDRLQSSSVPVLGRISELASFVKTNHIDTIYLALPMATQPRILALLDDLKDTTASILFIPDIFVTDLIQGRVADVGGVPVVAVCDTPFTGLSGVFKRLSDIALSSLLLVLLAPVLVGLAIGVKHSSPGPVIFKQRRYGLDGKEILVYKFRSMTTTDNGNVVKQATRNDSRITPFGAFIRRTSLDELPQFINVLQGRMSIVGPRPHAVAHNETYRKLIKGYMVRHKVKPGITGWAQVNGYRGETDTIDKMERRIEFDLEYLRNWSLSLDLWIIIKTVLVVFKDRNAY
ncbi:MAG TPA: undecaprenyl-phosphate glucose phosphotransferase [Rhodocyclaceae bacterium]|nr:undecaprenyl-phosphate glucose phosphotransferase [Rhodocyclaceae bacterium]